VRAVVGIHSYQDADGDTVRRQATIKVGLKGHALSALEVAAKPTATATVAVAFAACAVRAITLPFSDPNKAAQVVPFEVDGMVPFDIDDAVVSHELLDASQEGSRFLAAVAPLDAIGELIGEHGGGDQPQVILPEAFALYHFARALNDKRPLLVLDVRAGRTMMVLLADGRWLGSRQVSLGAHGSGGDLLALRRAAHSLWVDSGTMPEAVVVTGDDGDNGAMFADGLGLDLLPLAECTPMLAGMAGMEAKMVASHAVAIGVGLAAVDGKRRMNLRGGPFALTEASQGVVLRRMAGVGVGVLLILGLATGNAWVRHQVAQERFDVVKNSLVSQYKMVFPEATKVVNPVTQAKNELKRLKAKALLYGSAGATPLGYLNQISQAIPKSLRLDVFEFSIEGTRLRMEAQALSFDAIDQIKAQLSSLPGIERVRVSDAKMSGRDKRVKFRVHATLTEGV